MATVLHSIGFSEGVTFYQSIYNNAVGMLVLTCAGSLPGYCVSVLTMDTIGRKPIQVFGFFALTIMFCILGFAHGNLSQGSTLALYIMAQFFFNFGPRTTTFTIPAEVFPTRYRATVHGLSAGTGKLGEIAAQAFSATLLYDDKPDQCDGEHCQQRFAWMMQISALSMLLGTLVSLMVPETKGKTLEELAGESGESGEAPDGRDAGPNGEKCVEISGARKWARRLLGGGKAAGFSRSWQGATNSAENALDAQARGNRLGRERQGTKPARDARGWPASSRAAGLNEYDRFALVGEDAAASQMPGPAHTVLVEWGAGWGRMDRGGRSASRDNMILRDVGRLLE